MDTITMRETYRQMIDTAKSFGLKPNEFNDIVAGQMEFLKLEPKPANWVECAEIVLEDLVQNDWLMTEVMQKYAD